MSRCRQGIRASQSAGLLSQRRNSVPLDRASVTFRNDVPMYCHFY